MKIYLVKRIDSIGWDEYDACVVAAKSPEKAKSVWQLKGYPVECVLVGTTDKYTDTTVILDSFLAG